MRPKVIGLVLVWLSLVASLAFGAVPPRPSGHIYDPQDILRAEQEAQLEQKLVEYQNRSQHAIVIAIVNGLDGRATIAQYANDIFHAWGIGDKQRDDGVLVLWNFAGRQVRIEVGYGLEGQLPDGRSGQILREEILPRFKDGQYAEGLFVGVDSIIKQLEYREDPLPVTAATDYNTIPLYVAIASIVGVVSVAFLIVAWYERRQQKRQAEIDKELRDIYQKTAATAPPKPTGYSTAARPYTTLKQSATVKKVEPKKKSIQREESTPERSYPAVVVMPDPTPEPTWSRRSESSSYSSSYDSGSSWSSSDSGSSSFGGGDSGGGGADGSY